MPTDTPVSPEDAFGALGSEHRISVLRTLLDAAESEDRGLSFSEIYDRVEIDSTSQLAYHLDRLAGVFVRKSEGVYTLTQAGDRVVRVVLSGTYSERPDFETTALDGTCPHCESGDIVAEHREPFLAVACESCDETLVTYNLPPAELRGRTNAEVLRSCNRRVHHEYAVALRGTCSLCGGVTDLTVERGGSDDPAAVTCVAECSRCRLVLYAPLEVRLLHHPAVVSFYWGHGVDAADLPLWKLPEYVGDWDVAADETGGWEVTVRYGGESLRVAVDENLGVTALD